MSAVLPQVLLVVHIIGGSVALLCAGGALVTKKGGPGHRFFGKGYVAGMTAVFLSALALAAFQANLFLLLIAFFSFYLVFSGFRFTRNKTGAPGEARLDRGRFCSAVGGRNVGFGLFPF